MRLDVGDAAAGAAVVLPGDDGPARARRDIGSVGVTASVVVDDAVVAQPAFLSLPIRGPERQPDRCVGLGVQVEPGDREAALPPRPTRPGRSAAAAVPCGKVPSSVAQASSQPSAAVVLPSSHSSLPSRSPLPHSPGCDEAVDRNLDLHRLAGAQPLGGAADRDALAGRRARDHEHALALGHDDRGLLADGQPEIADDGIDRRCPLQLAVRPARQAGRVVHVQRQLVDLVEDSRLLQAERDRADGGGFGAGEKDGQQQEGGRPHPEED